MPDQDRVRVQLKDGRKGTVDRSQLLHVLANGGKALEEEGALKKAGRGAAIGAFEGAGVAPTQDPVKDTLEGLKGQAADMFAPWRHPGKLESYKKMLMANPAVTIPRAIGTKGLDVLKDFTPQVGSEVFDEQGNPTGQVKRPAFDIEKSSQDLTALVTQLLMLKGGKKAATTPISEGAVGKSVKTGTRELLGVGERTVEREASKAAESAAEKTKKFEEAKKARQQEVEEQQKGYETRKAKQLEKHEESVGEAKKKHAEGVDTAEKKLASSAAKEASARLNNERIRQAKQKLVAYHERIVKSTTDMIKKTHDTERGQLDTRWNDFNGKVKSLKGDLSKIGQDVLDAEKQDIKGSSENIKVFRDVLGRLKENMVEQEDGSMKFLDKQMRTLDHFRDYWRELGDVLYRKEGLPADVKAAVERVRNGLEREFEASIRDNYGNAVGDEMMTQYGELKNDWSGYKRVWHDRSRVNPLPRVLDLLQEQATTKGGVDVSGKIADALNVKHAGAAARTLLGDRAKFGASPELIRGLNAATAKLKTFEKLTQTVTETKVPKFPKYEEPKPPEIEPFKAKGKDPEAPEIKSFNPEEFRREKVLGKAEKLSDLTGWDILASAEGLREIFGGHPPYAWMYPVGKRVASRVIQRPSVLDWLVK